MTLLRMDNVLIVVDDLETVQYEDAYRLAYIRGPEGIIIALSEQLDSGG
jgi:hypothetical protein